MKKRGFTLIEVTLFLAVSALIVMGVMIGTTTSIRRRRYTDTVNDFVSFLRETYSEVVNVEITRTGSLGANGSCNLHGMVEESSWSLSGSWEDWVTGGDNDSLLGTSAGLPGRSDCAVYGKLVTFGEQDSGNTVHVYDIIGQTLEEESGRGGTLDSYFSGEMAEDEVLALLEAVKAEVIAIRVEDRGGQPFCEFAPAGSMESYTPLWDARLQTTAAEHTAFVGSLMIVRSPVSGTVHTYFLEGTAINVYPIVSNGLDYRLNDDAGVCGTSLLAYRDNVVKTKSRLLDHLSEFKLADGGTPEDGSDDGIDICIDSDDLDDSWKRRNVRILLDGHNSSAVKLVNQDTDDSAGGGSRCR